MSISVTDINRWLAFENTTHTTRSRNFLPLTNKLSPLLQKTSNINQTAYIPAFFHSPFSLRTLIKASVLGGDVTNWTTSQSHRSESQSGPRAPCSYAMGRRVEGTPRVSQECVEWGSEQPLGAVGRFQLMWWAQHGKPINQCNLPVCACVCLRVRKTMENKKEINPFNKKSTSPIEIKERVMRVKTVVLTSRTWT